MRKVRFGISLLFCVVGLTGCSIQGKWSLAEVEPTAARREAQYEVLTLQKDGSFYAEAKERGVQTTSGTYSFENDTLTLREHDGEQNAYPAKLSGDELRLEHIWQGQKVEMRYERVKE